MKEPVSNKKKKQAEILNELQREQLEKKLAKTRKYVKMMFARKEETKKEIKWLLEIKGDTRNSGSIFDRLNISPNLDFERILEFEFDDEAFANSIPTVEAILTKDGRIATT